MDIIAAALYSERQTKNTAAAQGAARPNDVGGNWLLKKTALIVLGLALALLAGCGQQHDRAASGASSSVAESAPVPAETADNAWSTDTPENHRMDGAVLQQLHAALDQSEIYASVTVRDGYIVDEYYREGYGADSVFRLNSCSKSFTGALVGIAIEEGLIGGVDDQLATYFPQLAGTEKGQITIGQLLQHTSGLEWHEWNGDDSSFFELNAAENWVDYVLQKPLVATPGSSFNYTTGGPHLLAAILEQVTDDSLFHYARTHLFEPLGMSSMQWRADPQNVLDGGNGIEMTARDAARFGQLYLNGGSWQGRQLVPRTWVEESTRAQVGPIGNSGSYGYLWWTRQFGAQGYDTYFAMGAMGQFIFVVPQLDLVTVMTSSPTQQDTYAPWPYFADYILAACH